MAMQSAKPEHHRASKERTVRPRRGYATYRQNSQRTQTNEHISAQWTPTVDILAVFPVGLGQPAYGDCRLRRDTVPQAERSRSFEYDCYPHFPRLPQGAEAYVLSTHYADIPTPSNLLLEPQQPSVKDFVYTKWISFDSHSGLLGAAQPVPLNRPYEARPRASSCICAQYDGIMSSPPHGSLENTPPGPYPQVPECIRLSTYPAWTTSPASY
ncbi:hypothetical protein QBC34DRAFT_425847 [Podospora aff. communis PSN243]|uniref:Uncharacterized protein n=1 Tax=Podospora aff. communis PSN243 TaxID=3040156 RepID=A0AAV9GMX3_9PEZI|nr:hypothetical protein QBC34DRAFT_425847 [Podospora aff. communis PSN243]